VDEQDWSSADAARATRASLGGCYTVAFVVLGALVILGIVVGLVIDLF
jgi:hypothetical protein